MRQLLALLFLKLIAMPAFPMGTKVPSEDYVDLGTMSIGKGPNSGIVRLPYYKPEGVEKILKPDTVALHVIELIVDGKVIEPHLQLGGFFEMADCIGTETVGQGGVNREIEMKWHPSRGVHWDPVEDKPSIRSYEYFPPEHIEEPLYYKIQYPAKEVFLIYGINYPSRHSNNFYPLEGEYDEEMLELMDKTYYVKWTIEWDIPRLSD